MSWKKIIKYDDRMEVRDEIENALADFLPDKIESLDELSPTIESTLMDAVGNVLYFNVDDDPQKADYSDKVYVDISAYADDDSEDYQGTFDGYVVFKPTKDGYEFIEATESGVY